MRIPVIGPYNTTDSINVDSQKTVNWYLEKTPAGRTEAALYPTPGCTQFGVAGSGPIRGMIEWNDTLYVVSGAGFYSVDNSGNTTLIDSINSSAGIVSMASSSTEIMIVDGVNGYTYNGTTFATIADGEYPDSADQVVFVEGYFIVNDPDKDQGLQIDGSFFWSDLRDGTAWQGTNFATAERDSDKLIAIRKSKRELWLFGEKSTEIWINTGGDPLFTPVGSGYSEWGIAARDSAASLDQSMIWLSQNELGQGLVVQATNFTPKIISTGALASAIASYNTISDAHAFVMQWKGHSWYVLTFPTEGVTWVYDATENNWFEWRSWGLDRTIHNQHAIFNGKHYGGHYSTGQLMLMDDDVYQEDGERIERLRRTTHIFSKSEYTFFDKLELEFEFGTGGSADGQVMVRWSDDYGHTWSQEYWRTIGKTGEYYKRMIWRRQGWSRSRIYEIIITDAVKPVMVSGFVSAKPSNREL